MHQPQLVNVRQTLVLLALLPLALPAFAQTAAVSATPQAQVTFYSSGPRMFGFQNRPMGAFKGRIYEDDRQLVFMEPGHFVTFQFDAGPHTFSANSWMSTHANDGGHIVVQLVAGQQYFLKSFFFQDVFGPFKMVLKEVNCEGARADNVHAKPLELQHLRPSGTAIFVPETSFPQCS